MGAQEIFSVSKMEENHSMELMKNLEKLCSNVRDSLRNAEERFHVAVEDMGDWEYWIGENNNYIFISPACENTTGYKPEEFFADKNLFFKLVHPDDYEQLIQHFKEEETGKEIAPINFRIINRKGEERFILHKCRRVYDRSGNYLGIRATNYDMTYIKHTEQEKEGLENRIKNYTSAIEQIGKLAMESVNNFNNMVQKILNCVEILRLESDRPGLVDVADKIYKISDENKTGQKFELTINMCEEVSYDHKGKLLLIDDEKFILDMASDMLKVINFDVITACTGADAIEIFRKQKDEITCVVLDFNMPDYDGKAVYEELRKIREDIPILISSGNNEQEVILKFDDSEKVPFLSKPYHFSTLVTKVNKLIDQNNYVHV